MAKTVEIAHLLQVVAVWSSMVIQCDPAAVGSSGEARESLQRNIILQGGGFMESDAAVIQASPSSSSRPARDSWTLVGSRSDVIHLGPHLGTLHGGDTDRSSARYNRYQEAGGVTSSDGFLTHRALQMRLNKLDHYFRELRIFDEVCRQRFLCEMSKDPAKFFPLSSTFLDETSLSGWSSGDEKLLPARLLTSDEGARLLTYIEASQQGLNREGCDTWTYRCPRTMETLIDFKSLMTWREVLKWLTVQMVARRN